MGLESTVLDLTKRVPAVLRPGGVTLEALRGLLGEVRVDAAALAPLESAAVPRSPGMKYKHYAPDADLVIVAGPEEARAALACRLYDEAAAAGERAVVLAPAEREKRCAPRTFRALGAENDPHSAAARLFAALRELDAQGFERIIAEAVEAEGIGLAVMNRLYRAAGFCVRYAE